MSFGPYPNCQGTTPAERQNDRAFVVQISFNQSMSISGLMRSSKTFRNNLDILQEVFC